MKLKTTFAQTKIWVFDEINKNEEPLIKLTEKRQSTLLGMKWAITTDTMGIKIEIREYYEQFRTQCEMDCLK